jgi:hypothetical protein
LSVVILIRHGQWDDIAHLQINPMDYNDAEMFFRAYQSTKLLSKAKWLPTSIDTRAVAVGKFEESEEKCRNTNVIWKAHRRGELNFLRDYERIFHSARRKIGEILGDDLYGWTELCDFGPGADGSTVRGLTAAYNKLSNPGSVTPGAYPYLNVFSSITRLGELFVGNVGTGRLDLELARGNRVTFVSKNAKTDRPIAVEPRWNIWMQKGLGAYLRRRLKLFGVDLDDQSVNQRRASEGSRTGKYATLDLASASDTVSKDVVLGLLPEPWVTVFDALRSPAYCLNGKWRNYEKWSSMGNGYTFELESLLFYALCSAVHPDVTVYGDDLVVPTGSVELIVKVLEASGFEVNSSKSFSSGPFRESCGSDAFLGVPVTPIYWKEPLNELGTLTLVNQVSILAKRLSADGHSRDRRLRPLWKDLVYRLPRHFQRRGPTSISTVVHDCSAAWSLNRKHQGRGWDGVWINVQVPVPRRYRFWDYIPALLSLIAKPQSPTRGSWMGRGVQVFVPDILDLLKLDRLPGLGTFTIRDRVEWKMKTIFIPSGYEDMGPWA